MPPAPHCYLLAGVADCALASDGPRAQVEILSTPSPPTSHASLPQPSHQFYSSQVLSRWKQSIATVPRKALRESAKPRRPVKSVRPLLNGTKDGMQRAPNFRWPRIPHALPASQTSSHRFNGAIPIAIAIPIPIPIPASGRRRRRVLALWPRRLDAPAVTRTRATPRPRKISDSGVQKKKKTPLVRAPGTYPCLPDAHAGQRGEACRRRAPRGQHARTRSYPGDTER